VDSDLFNHRPRRKPNLESIEACSAIQTLIKLRLGKSEAIPPESPDFFDMEDEDPSDYRFNEIP
jgi:hypothetical protein